ncbi:MAG: DUF72 domain-containing protein [Anaerolineae bacterium]|nr:DUF72 domain-containing protein [Anaerolineae bacterium]
MIKIGCCGFGRAQATYWAHLSLVEIQKTFYKPPRLETAQRWREEAPPEAEFTIKAWQLITHEASSPTYRKAKLNLEAPPDHYGAFRNTAEVLAAWQRTIEIAQALHASIVLLQCPASFTPTEEHLANLRGFLQTIERNGFRLAWEPRGTWPSELIRELCQEYDLIHAVDPFKGLPTTEGTAYFRLHGRTGYRYHYTDEDLQQLLRWAQAYEEAYCLFNNVSMWEDALRFQALAQQEGGAFT